MKTEKIFITDDDKWYANVVANTLSIHKFSNVEVFTNSRSMLNNLYQMPNIIVLDLIMPQVTGIEALKEIKSFDPDIFVIILSGQKDVELAVQTLKYGAFDYIIKDDVSIVRLLNTIKKITELEKPKKISYFSKLLTGKDDKKLELHI